MNSSISASNSLLFHKIHFSLSKRVRFGQAIYVSGNIQELGLWEPSKAYRLKWNEVRLFLIQGDFWSGSLLLNAHSPKTI